MKSPLALAAPLAALILAACGGGGSSSVQPPSDGPTPVQACSVADQRQSLDAWLQAQYYWSPMLQPASSAAPDIDAYFQSRLWRPLDRYSYSEPTEIYQQVFFTGYRYGYGYVLVWDDAARTVLRVRNVEPQSPVAAAGVKRGDIVLSIDGQPPAAIMGGAVPAVGAAGIPRVFTLRDPSTGAVRDVTVVSAFYPLTPLAQVSVLDGSRAGVPTKVGYMAYHQFVSYSRVDLLLSVQRLADQGVRDLVLDLRYNGGGSVSVSRDLASLIGGSGIGGQLYTTLQFNDQQRQQDQELRFTTAAERPTRAFEGLDRVVVITSGGTASASELLVNGLRPYMNVLLVGETTYGKPYGFVPRSYCGTTFSAVNFEAFNAAGVAGYTQGFTPDCAVADDLDHPLGDPAERKTQVALNLLATGSCGPLARAAFATRAGSTAPKTAGEQPAPGMFP